jgi:hypothetical protein
MPRKGKLRRWGALFASTAFAASPAPAASEVLRFEIAAVAPAFGGQSFGAAGAYEVVTGRVVIAVDPAHPRNAGIVDLERAPRNAQGKVEASAPVIVLRPADPSRGNGTLIYDVVNRGRILALALFNEAPFANDLSAAATAGNGFLMRQGYTLAWSGWQGDAPTAGGLLRLEAPVLAGVTGPSREEFVFDHVRSPVTVELTYPVAAGGESGATLTVRAREPDARATPPGLDFKFVSPTRIEISRPPGFDAGAIYELVYTARDPMVTGLSFAAIRDLVSFLRYGVTDPAGLPNPLARNGQIEIARAIGFGISQSGRLLRDFIYQGHHLDEAGRPVFDGLWPHIAGARRGFFNARFAQPGRYSRQHEDHLYPGDQFPFTYGATTDPLSGRTDGVLARCTAASRCPRIFHTDTDTEGFQARAWLLTTAPDGAPLRLPANVRAYYLAGLPHFSAPNIVAMPTANCAAYNNPLHAGPAMRALLEALQAWLVDGIAPPESRYPSLADGTLIAPEAAKADYPALPGIASMGVVNRVHLVDHAVMPPLKGAAYPTLLPTLDSDGHALGALRLPAIEAPRATYLGWNLRGTGYAAGALCSLTGSTIPLPGNAATAAAARDTRRPLDARYPTPDAYVQAVEQAARKLAEARLLLPEDVESAITAARSGRLARLP